MLKIYVYANCSTCRDALRWLKERGAAAEVRPIREQPPAVAELRRMLGYCGGNLRRLFNTSGQDYRAQGLKDRLPAMSVDGALALLAADGRLVKRPFLLGPDFGFAGFDPAAWAQRIPAAAKR